MKGEFDLYGEAEKLYSNLDKISDGKTSGESYFTEKTRYIKNFKKAALICIHGATKQFAKNLINEQEVLNNIAEIMMDTYVAESLALRIEKMETLKGTSPIYRDMLDVNVYDTAGRVRKFATDCVNSFASPEDSDRLVTAIEHLTKVAGVNIKDARRRIADKLIEDNTYKF
jgi:hypothetical protein